MAVFATAVGLLALHTITDAFLAPQRGTAWSDHLAAGLVPLALLAAAAFAFRRARPGLRGLIAAVLGVLAIEGALLAVADITRGNGRASDWTGFLLWPAGLALCGLAIMILWRSRRPDGRRYLRRTLLVLGAALGMYWVIVPVAVAFYATHRPRADVKPAALGAPYRTVAVPTADGLELAAWYVPSRNGAAVISFPTRIGKLEHARMLVRHGYGLLLLDMRGYEGSDGAPNAFGWGSTRDIDAGVAWLRLQPDIEPTRIGGLGFSVGGEQMLEAAAENPGLAAVVSEGAGERSINEALIRGPAGWFTLPANAVQTTATMILSDTLPPPSLEDVVSKIAPRAVFLIYAAHGQGGEDLNTKYFDAAGRPKEIWRVPDAGHTGGLTAHPTEYERRVVGFFDRFLLPGKASRRAASSDGDN